MTPGISLGLHLHMNTWVNHQHACTHTPVKRNMYTQICTSHTNTQRWEITKERRYSFVRLKETEKPILSFWPELHRDCLLELLLSEPVPQMPTWQCEEESKIQTLNGSVFRGFTCVVKFASHTSVPTLCPVLYSTDVVSGESLIGIRVCTGCSSKNGLVWIPCVVQGLSTGGTRSGWSSQQTTEESLV